MSRWKTVPRSVYNARLKLIHVFIIKYFSDQLRFSWQILYGLQGVNLFTFVVDNLD